MVVCTDSAVRSLLLLDPLTVVRCAGYLTPRAFFLKGSVLDPHHLPDELLERADVVFWNNYGGHWEQDVSVMDDGTSVRLQDQIRDRLIGTMHDGA